MKKFSLIVPIVLAASGCSAVQRFGADFWAAEKRGAADLQCQVTEGCARPAHIHRPNRGPVRPYENPPPEPGRVDSDRP